MGRWRRDTQGHTSLPRFGALARREQPYSCLSGLYNLSRNYNVFPLSPWLEEEEEVLKREKP
jgi:hypothetical protein